MEIKDVEKLGAPIVKMVWDSVIHPELLKLEAEIGTPALKAIVLALDPIVSAQIDAELDKLAQG